MLARFLAISNVSILKNLLITDVQVRQIQARIPDLLDDVSQFREPLAARVRVGRESSARARSVRQFAAFSRLSSASKSFSSDWGTCRHARQATRSSWRTSECRNWSRPP